jgi:hypothetical protein
MTEKRLLWGLGGVTALVLVAALAVYVVRALEDRITPENFDRIREGMTEREVNAILGRPADHRRDIAWGDPSTLLTWVGDRFLIVTNLDERGTVDRKIGQEVEGSVWAEPGKPSVWKKLRGLLPW